MGFTVDIEQNGQRYMLLSDAETAWAAVARTATCGWDVPDDVLLQSFGFVGRACVPGTCQDGLYSHWVECNSDYRTQITEGELPKSECRRKDTCPLYRGAGGPCWGWAVALPSPSVSDISAWLVWDALVQLQRKLGITITLEYFASRKAVRCEYHVAKYWHLTDLTAVAAEVVRRQTLCEDMIAFEPPEIGDDTITLFVRPTERFLDEIREARAAKKTAERWSGGKSQTAGQSSSGCAASVIAGVIFFFVATLIASLFS